MELTAEIFKQMVGSLAADVAQPVRRRDERRGPRRPTPAHATLLPFSDALGLGAFEVPLRDLSRGGFAFLHDRAVPLDDAFALVLPESSARPLVILCTVAHWQPLAPGLYLIGARFTQVLRQSGTRPNLDLDHLPPRARKAS